MPLQLIDRLLPNERIIGWRLTEGRTVRISELLTALYADREDGGPEWAAHSVHVAVSRLRAFARPRPFRILTACNGGWYVPEGELEALRTALAAEIEKFVDLRSTGKDPSGRWTPSAPGARRFRYPERRTVHTVNTNSIGR